MAAWDSLHNWGLPNRLRKEPTEGSLGGWAREGRSSSLRRGHNSTLGFAGGTLPGYGSPARKITKFSELWCLQLGIRAPYRVVMGIFSGLYRLCMNTCLYTPIHIRMMSVYNACHHCYCLVHHGTFLYYIIKKGILTSLC